MKLLVGFVLLLMLQLSVADNLKYEMCFNEAGLHYGLPPKLLKIIATVESKMNPYAINIQNRNGSIDIGLMQINSSWLRKLAQIGVTQKDLLDGCKNIQVGAWILSQNVKKYGLTSEAIGRYNSANQYYKELYVKKIIKVYNKDFKSPRTELAKI